MAEDPSIGSPVFVPRLLAKEGDQEEQQPISAFLDASAIVVLGDPGAGKTELFKKAAEEEGGRYMKVRELLRTIPAPHRQPLYLDAFDEVRAQRRDGHSVLDEVISKLLELGQPRFRLSCRAADWFGGLDESELRSASSDGTIQVLHLLPMTEEDIGQIVACCEIDQRVFLKEAHTHGVVEWLSNPQDLMLLLEALEGGEWPDSREEIFRHACESLTKEENPTHSRSRRRGHSIQELQKAAGYLCALHIIAGTTGYAFERDVASDDFRVLANIGDSAISGDTLEESARRRLFRHEGHERVVPMHRTVAEYLAARYLVDRVREGHPLQRVLALITGFDGGIPTELRGLFAWLTCLATEHSELLLQKDPLGVLLYGDLVVLKPNARRRLLRSLSSIAREDPYFRSGYRRSKTLAAFATPRLEEDLRQILEDRDQPWQLTELILEALTVGQPLPGFGDLLLEIIRDPKRVHAVKSRAAEAFCRLWPQRTEDLQVLLDEVQCGMVRDAHDRIRHELLNALFPLTIDASKIVEYIFPSEPDVISVYNVDFLSSEFFEQLPPHDLPKFLDALAERDLPEQQSAIRRIGVLVSGALTRGLEIYGESVSTSRLYRWLGIPLSSDRVVPENILDEQEVAPIRDWFERYSGVYLELLRYGFELRDWERFDLFLAGFVRRCPADFPPSFCRFLLQLASALGDDSVAQDVFREAVHHSYDQHSYGVATIEDFHRFVEQHQGFADAWEIARVYKIDSRPPRFSAQLEVLELQKEEKRQRLRYFKAHADAISRGEDWAALSRLAGEYYNASHRSELQQLAPLERLTYLFNPECAVATLTGFVRSVSNPEQRDISKLGSLCAKGRVSGRGVAVHAGMDWLWAGKPELIPNLPIPCLTRSVVYHLTCSFPEWDAGSGWVEAILDAHPEECAESIMEFWRPSLEQKIEHVSGFDYLRRWQLVGKIASFRLLEEFPRTHPKSLKELLLACLHYCEHERLAQTARRQLAKPQGLRTEQYLLWLGTAFLLEPEAYLWKVTEHAPRPVRTGSEIKRASLLRDYFIQATDERKDLWQNLPLRATEELILSFTRAYPHIPILKSGYGPFDKEEVPSMVRQRIDWLGNRAEDEARASLIRLRDHRVMAPWRDHICHTLANQARKRREAAFRQPFFEETVDSLKGGPPANAADLFALLCDHLRQLADEIRDGSSDGYKMFWNLDQHENLSRPLIEGTCRDRVLERLKPLLGANNVSIGREDHHADHKRADLRASYASFGVPVECKRHGHEKLWSAIKDQLISLYARDPESSGYGVYLVFWFGLDDLEYRASPPEGKTRPTSACELEAALRQTVPADHANRIEVICMDVSRRNYP